MRKNSSTRHLKMIPSARQVRAAIGILLGGVSALGSAYAVGIETDNPDIKMSWDNTFKYSAGWRLNDADAKVADNSLGPQMNTNDGDLNFKKGAMISNRLDWLSEFDLRYKNAYGLRISGAAWYDDVYSHSNDNSGVFVNSTSVSSSNQFTDATRDLHGRKAEFRDAFVYGSFTPGEMNVNVKAGQFTQLYGESLFFGYNGIAAAQTPLDLARALSVPNSQFKEIAMPVKQLSTQIQINPQVSVGAYYQFEWKKNSLPAAGSYFSFADFADAGGESLILGPGAAVRRGEDIKASDTGQGGAQVKFKVGDSEYGFYAAQFHDKMPQFYVRPGVNAGGGFIGDYVLVYGENIKTYGASISTLLGETNVAAELSIRNNMPMVARGITVVLPGNTTANGGNNPAYPVGDSLHLNMSAISVLGASPLWHGASFVGEFAYNQRLKITKNEDQLDPLATESASAIQFVFQPEYFQVMPGLDLQVPIGIAYGISGRSSIAGASSLMPSEGGGNISIGIKGDYKKTWQTSLNLTHYFGSSGAVIKYGTAVPELSYQNFHGDRDFISLSVQRTF
ncbi:MAG: DUF1302 domain-containing protein [Rhodoferax sp.]|uniref:DUF1302 domain-containing protein n=1 Tax=Rhodoferax sp. TaxID=50421 RepID=UPI003019A99A